MDDLNGNVKAEGSDGNLLDLFEELLTLLERCCKERELEATKN